MHRGRVGWGLPPHPRRALTRPTPWVNPRGRRIYFNPKVRLRLRRLRPTIRPRGRPGRGRGRSVGRRRLCRSYGQHRPMPPPFRGPSVAPTGDGNKCLSSRSPPISATMEGRSSRIGPRLSPRLIAWLSAESRIGYSHSQSQL